MLYTVIQDAYRYETSPIIRATRKTLEAAELRATELANEAAKMWRETLHGRSAEVRPMLDDSYLLMTGDVVLKGDWYAWGIYTDDGKPGNDRLIYTFSTGELEDHD
jgi:hypothetical protein